MGSKSSRVDGWLYAYSIPLMCTASEGVLGMDLSVHGEGVCGGYNDFL